MADKSQVIAFRLNPDNPDELRALEWLEQWREAGYDLRQIFVPLILAKADIEPVTPAYMSHQTHELIVSISDLRQVIRDLKRTGQVIIPQSEPIEGAEIGVDDPIVQSLLARKSSRNLANTED
jgi:hypothetical protein